MHCASPSILAGAYTVPLPPQINPLSSSLILALIHFKLLTIFHLNVTNSGGSLA
jgi:hypothetical protein